ncbi:MAG: prepilin-type N-terminal cleavage/methylation domain-containing protein [Gemmobacter sp.]
MSGERRCRSPDAGLTLVEMLVVLAIIGAAGGAVMFGGIAGGRAERAASEAIRLANHLSLGADEALVTGHLHRLAWDARGYSFERRDPTGDWVAASLPALAMRRDLPASLWIGRPSADDAPVLIPSSGISAPAWITVNGSGAPAMIVFDGARATLVGPSDPRAPS